MMKRQRSRLYGRTVRGHDEKLEGEAP